MTVIEVIRHLIDGDWPRFRLITQDRIRRGVFTSVPELEAAIHEYLDNHNADPSPSSGPNWRKKSSQKSPVREMRSNSLLPGIKR